MLFLRLIPKSMWIVLLITSIAMTSLLYSYKLGVNHENDRWESQMDSLVKEQTKAALTSTRLKLERVLKVRRDRDSVIRDQQATLEMMKNANNKLKVEMDEVFKNFNDNRCSDLPDPYIRLLKGMYNKKPPVE